MNTENQINWNKFVSRFEYPTSTYYIGYIKNDENSSEEIKTAILQGIVFICDWNKNIGGKNDYISLTEKGKEILSYRPNFPDIYEIIRAGADALGVEVDATINNGQFTVSNGEWYQFQNHY